MTPPPCLLPPREPVAGFEWSVHACPRRHKAEVDAVWPGLSTDALLVVPVCQRSSVDLVGIGPHVEADKDKLLERFTAFAVAATSALEANGFWADYVDPCSGLPMRHREGGGAYGEVQALVTLRGFATANAGCCTIVLHPRWGSSVYPASLVTTAPVERLEKALDEALASLP